MKRSFILLLVAILPIVIRGQSFRVVGYLPQYRMDYVDKIRFDYLTHINIAFANPDTGGMLTTKNDIRSAVDKAHQNNVKVMISLAGGFLFPEWKSAWTKYLQNDKRSFFIANIIQYVKANELDGVDVDLEWKDVDKNYSPFIIELKNALSAEGKILSAALPGKHRYANISNEALNAFDFINIMAYDACGPWNPKKPGQHSSAGFAKNCIDYWTLQQGVAPEKLSLGLPCYGYNFSDPSNVYGFYYRSMIERDVDHMYKDQVGGMYYNGIPTIKSKTQLAFDKVGGVMMWELSQDAIDTLQDYSLLKAIHETVLTNQANNEKTANDFQVRIYPNPNTHFVYIETKETNEEAEISIFDVKGTLILSKKQKMDVPVVHLETKTFECGTYFCTVRVGNQIQTKSLIKG